MKNALAVVQGFDFVPETLRSDTFAKAAHRVMEAHFAMNNYYKEAAPMQELALLGTTIPRPAFPLCMTAILCVRLGKYFGHAWSAQSSANELLKDLRKEQWEYYLNECISSDKTILDKIEDEKPGNRWVALCAEFGLPEMRSRMTRYASLLQRRMSSMFARPGSH